MQRAVELEPRLTYPMSGLGCLLFCFSRAAAALGLADEARALHEQAAEQGSIEAQRGLP
jgi:hypothetical protein